MGGNKQARQDGPAFFAGTLTALEYQDILRKSLLPAATELFEDDEVGWEFQQDKATAHMASFATKFLHDESVAMVRSWPTKGDDINPIENLWAIVDEKIQDRRYSTVAGMRRVVQGEWKNIDERLLANLVDSIPDRLRRVVKARGGSIKNVN
jgi:hypothetical protein